MSAPVRYLAGLTGRLRRHQGGAMIVELVIMLPLLLWCFTATWVFFDAYRTKAVNARAAYTIGDTLSRETGYVTPDYLLSLKTLQDFLVDGRPTRLRVSVVGYDALLDRYTVRWSIPTGTGLELLDGTALEDMRDRLPEIPGGEIVTLVESWIDYTPLFDVGLAPFTFEEMAVTRPRFAGQLCTNLTALAGAATAIC
ncbi:TadE/TadG family type IV pilus assembly protein [Limimaricola litoreus]|uniref:Pilus assembly protein n=1 Tax=Limimaricola litoreus TaxID=2955316 RepID=A0A9X2JPG1_9RHOB|nr:pilus assembly protein [Limimaricola litoreus]MCP1168150.1 pilus assembly protein [Limimaricola litoreus]